MSMRIVLNTQYDAGCTTILRQLGERLQMRGHEVSHNDWEHYGDYDLVLFLGNDSRIAEAKRRNPRALVGILCPYLHTESWRQEARMADFLLADSIEMRDIFLQYNKNIFVYYMFPEIPEAEKRHENQEKLIIGYHGNRSHLDGIENLSRALDALAEHYPVEFWAIYNQERRGRWRINTPRRCPVRHIQWTPDYYTKLAQCDIGVIPAKIPINVSLGRFMTRVPSSFLRNWPKYDSHDYLVRFKHPTNPGRVYPFSQLRIPVVADFLPSYAQVIRDGYSGYLAYSQEGWYDALERLIKSPELRDTMSRNLKEYIEATCSPERNIEGLIKFLEQTKA